MKLTHAIVHRHDWFHQRMTITSDRKPSALLASDLAGLYTAGEFEATNVELYCGHILVADYVRDQDTGNFVAYLT